MKMKFFWLLNRQFGIQVKTHWIGFRWIDTPHWRTAGCVYLGFFKLAW